MTPKGIIPAPNINVTPLIDVLLVLLIIFMVAAPLRPHRFLAKLPSVPERDRDLRPNPDTLVVTIQPDRTLKLNELTNMGTVYDVTPLALKLKETFEQRIRNLNYQKTVFIKAPRHLPYGDVTRVLDGLKATGADPVGLQLDDLK
ncbi:MAG TPA: biopolymer transporter ExbD [Pyrinomonadaceae bacterium]|nr:biopolymer transporter ExbD [Pyrinomonadaceae bacterium]